MWLEDKDSNTLYVSDPGIGAADPGIMSLVHFMIFEISLSLVFIEIWNRM